VGSGYAVNSIALLRGEKGRSTVATRPICDESSSFEIIGKLIGAYCIDTHPSDVFESVFFC